MTGLEVSSADLVRAARGGDAGAFAEIVHRERPTLVMAARALTGDFHEGEDAAQEALVTAFLRLESLREPSSFGPWLSRILVRVAHARRRALRRGARRADLEGLPDAASDEDARLAALRTEVDRLPEKYRVLVSLHHLRGHGYREVAAATGLAEKRVKSRLFQARELLRRRLAEEDGHGD
ncbi:MAG: RNA polymerase sigma factor [Planctomycetota bacterium]